ncbi:MAG: toprim domain-containing protein [Prevotellaceae bacterium]|jgi:hypothetical protein|nr:toprim domain-containing protein [Prevotellaceae bacterium]
MLKKEAILAKTNNGLNVFRYYISGEWRVGHNFLNPLYDDRKASCNVYFDRKSGAYKIKDFGNDDFSGDCFSFVGNLKNLNCNNSKDFVEILQIINNDLRLNLAEENFSSNGGNIAKTVENFPEKPDLQPEKIKPYSVVYQQFTQKDFLFWGQYGITSDILRNYKVSSLKEFKSENKEGKPFSVYSTENEPIYCYSGKKYVKLYRPFSKIRFMYGGVMPENYCFGLEQLPAKSDILFITGGEKDVLTLVSQGFHAICFNSETSNISKNIIKKLSYRFKHIVLLFDVDKTGLEASKKQENQLSEFDVKRLVLPLSGEKNEKDVSDFFKIGKSKNDFKKIFLDFLENFYSETMAILKPCEIDFSHPPKNSEVVISINEVPLGTEGNLLGITGGEGTGKSNYVGSLISGAITQNEKINTLGTNILQNENGKAILLYDTEQSETQLFKNISAVLKRAECSNMPPFFKAYCLTSMSRKERLRSIVQSMDKFYYQFGGIHLVVIDGIADLVRCANDEGESVGVIDELYRLAGIYRACVVCVLHFVPNGMKLRGHLGSELQRKAAAILSIEKDNNPEISVVKTLKVRDGSPLDVPLVQFSWDKEKGMHVYFGEKPKAEKDKRKEIELFNVAKSIFSNQKHLNYSDLCEKLQKILDVKERTAKGYVKFMKEREIIIVNENNFYSIKN